MFGIVMLQPSRRLLLPQVKVMEEKCFKSAAESERNHTSARGPAGAVGGGFNRSVLICVWSSDVWREGRIRERWSVERQEESSFSSAKGPLSPTHWGCLCLTGKQKEWEEEEEESELEAFSSDRVRKAEQAPSLSLSARRSRLNRTTLVWI